MHVKGLYMYFHGQSSRLFMGYNGSFGKLNTLTPKTFEIDLKRTMFFYIRGSEGELSVSIHYDGEEKFQPCHTFDFRKEDMELFFVNFFARSGKSSKFMIDVKSLVFSSDVENIGISEFEARMDDEAQKLFKQISFYSLNESALKSKKKTIDDEDLKVKKVFDSHSEIFGILDYTNILMDKNLEEGSEMIEFLANQKLSTDGYAKSILESMNGWIENTAKQFEIMEKDALDLVTEYEQFDLDSEFEKTKKIMGKLTNKVSDNWVSLQIIREYSSQIKDNLAFLKDKKQTIESFPRLVKEFLGASFSEHGESYSKSFLTMFAVFGAIIVLVLFAILRRLGASAKKRGFD
jgi:hypothetical protein